MGEGGGARGDFSAVAAICFGIHTVSSQQLRESLFMQQFGRCSDWLLAEWPSSIAGRSFSLGSAFVAALTPTQPPGRCARQRLSTGVTLPRLQADLASRLRMYVWSSAPAPTCVRDRDSFASLHVANSPQNDTNFSAVNCMWAPEREKVMHWMKSLNLT